MRAAALFLAAFASAASALQHLRPAIRSRACTPPALLGPVTTWPCNTAGANVTWVWTPESGPVPFGSFSLKSAPSMCLGLFGTNSLSGAPSAALVACGSASTRWSFFPNQAPTNIYSAYNGNLLEVYDNVLTPGTGIETWANNGGANQLWTWNASTGQLVTSLTDADCMAVC